MSLLDRNIPTGCRRLRIVDKSVELGVEFISHIPSIEFIELHIQVNIRHDRDV